MQTQTYEEKKRQKIGMKTLNYEKSQNIGMQTQNYEEKVQISGCNLRIMKKKAKDRDENSEL